MECVRLSGLQREREREREEKEREKREKERERVCVVSGHENPDCTTHRIRLLLRRSP